MQQTVRCTIEERVSLLTAYLYHDVDYAGIVGDFQHHFPNWPVSMRQMIHRLNKQFQQMGSVVDLKRLIKNECDALRKQPEIFCKSCLTFWNRCKRCTDENGFQFEYL